MAARDLPLLLVVDVETTGLRPLVHDVVEVGAVLLDGRTLEERCSFGAWVRRNAAQHATMLARATPEALRVNGYVDQGLVADEDAVVEGVESRGQISRHLAHMAGDPDGVLLVGQNVRFDAEFLFDLWRGYAPEWLADKRRWLDTRHLAWLLQFSGEIRNRSLDDLARWAGVERPAVHRALDDARATAAVLRAMVARFGVLGVHRAHV